MASGLLSQDCAGKNLLNHTDQAHYKADEQCHSDMNA